MKTHFHGHPLMSFISTLQLSPVGAKEALPGFGDVLSVIWEPSACSQAMFNIFQIGHVFVASCTTVYPSTDTSEFCRQRSRLYHTTYFILPNACQQGHTMYVWERVRRTHSYNAEKRQLSAETRQIHWIVPML